jgi:hypothetical protein
MESIIMSQLHRKFNSPEYNAWTNMKGRCYNYNHPRYFDYGGRGITVCDRWRTSFEEFLADMGERPSPNHTLDRKDNNGNYEPGNCRWATIEEQGNNKSNNVRIEFNGKSMTVAQWSRYLGIPIKRIYSRIKYGLKTEEVLSLESLKKRKI